MKLCNRCGQTKPLGSFHRRGSAGRHPWCKECCRSYGQEYRQRTLEEQRRKGRERERRKRQDDPTYLRRNSLWTLFRLTLSDYEAKLAGQGGVCAVCGTAPAGAFLHVDHDHACCPGSRSCGRCLRDLLCSRCNGGPGMADNPELLRKKAAYLLEWRERHLAATQPG